MVAVQAEGCAPVVEAMRSHAANATPWVDARTYASGLRVPAPLGDGLILQALRESGGTAIAVSDGDGGQIQPGDYVLLWDGRPVPAGAVLESMVAGLPTGKQAVLLLVRGPALLEVAVTGGHWRIAVER